MLTLLANCLILENNKQKAVDILINKNKITKIAKKIKPTKQMQVIDINKRLVVPGLIDVHVHWREPGYDYKETIKTGSMSAAMGGFTLAMPMPNLNPVPHNVENIKKEIELLKQYAVIRAIPYGSITQDENGEALSDIENLKDYVFGYSDDGKGVQSALLMYQAMSNAQKVNKPIAAHCEDKTLFNNGVINEGETSKKLNLKGVNNLAESVQIARDVLLAKVTKCHYHVCHVSTKESLQLIQDAKNNKVNVTCEVTPHHLLSNDSDIKENNALWKMNPPLRNKEDQQALIKAVKSGLIDIIATDHAPHAKHEKENGFEKSAFGIIGSQHAFSLLYTKFVKTKIFTLQKLVDLFTKNVAKIFKLPYGIIGVNKIADLAIIDLNKKQTILESTIESKGKNTPYLNQQVYGINIMTIVDGKIVYFDKDEYDLNNL